MVAITITLITSYSILGSALALTKIFSCMYINSYTSPTFGGALGESSMSQVKFKLNLHKNNWMDGMFFGHYYKWLNPFGMPYCKLFQY